MREILFRGKTASGVWVEGDLIINSANGISFSYIRYKVNAWNYSRAKVDPETVGQYTGLTDKNGKKIFEGDVVKWDGTEISQIRYCEGVYRLCNAKGYYGVSLHNHYSYVEVIGNIHDNPELLRGE